TIPYLNLGPDTFICDYEDLVLSAGIPFNAGADSAFSYVWSDNSTNPTLVVNLFGQYWVTKTDSFGCAVSDSIWLTVETSPIIPGIKDTAICIGDTISFSARPF